MPAEAAFIPTLPFGEPLIPGVVGGAFGRELSRAGEAAAAIAFVAGELPRLFGSRARRHAVAASMSDWTTDLLTRGARGRH